MQDTVEQKVKDFTQPCQIWDVNTWPSVIGNSFTIELWLQELYTDLATSNTEITSLRDCIESVKAGCDLYWRSS